MKKFAVFAFLLSCQILNADQFGHDENLQNTNWKKVFNQLFYWNISKYPVQGSDARIIRNQYRHSLYYSQLGFNDAYKEIAKDKRAGMPRINREAILGFDANHKLLDGSDAREKLTAEVGHLNSKEASRVFEVVRGDSETTYPVGSNYFDTKSGLEVSRALSNVVVVIIPGFGSHTIPDYSFATLVEDANRHYGRPANRVARKTSSGESIYDGDNDPVTFYSKFIGTQKIELDVIHPMGYELGNSMGQDSEAADNLATWLRNISNIPTYKNKQFIFVGYSKGTPIAHNMLARYPDLRARTLFLTTLAGVNQGALPAEAGINSLTEKTCRAFGKDLNSEDPQKSCLISGAQAIENTKVQPAGNLLDYINPSLGMLLKYGIDNKLFGNFFQNATGVSLAAAPTRGANIASTKEGFKALLGVYDMTLFQRVKWNLVNLNDKIFTSPLTIFNLSMIAAQEDFLLPDVIADDRPMGRSEITPSFLPNGQIDVTKLSRDKVFLWATSITGFIQSEAGLFDTQVSWLDTKSMALDKRPLGKEFGGGLSRNELELIRAFVSKQVGVNLPENFSSMNRNDVLELVNRSSNTSSKNLNFVDLGEMRGTHWDPAFVNVYKPGRDHTFPRKAMLSALLETLAVYSAAISDGAK